MRPTFVAFVGVTLLTVIPALAEQFSFIALGDTAYNGERDQIVYTRLIETINEAKPAFTIHIGDIWGLEYCDDAHFDEAVATFALFDHPLIYTPGDNEWTDCHYRASGAFDPLERLDRLRSVFFKEAVSLGSNPMPLVSQGRISPFVRYVENVRWLRQGILFFTMNVAGSANNYRYENAEALVEAQERTEANIAWLRDSFRIARENAYPGVVIAVHAEMFDNGAARDGLYGPHGPLVREIRTAAERFSRPVLLIHGDSHEFVVDRPFLESQGELEPAKYTNVIRLEVFGAPEVRAVKVSVDTETPWLFGFEPLYNQ